MSASAVALSIVAVVVGATMAFALLSVGRIKMDPQQYIVGGRSFGTILLWVLMAGEIYTSFTFLGMAGWAYGKGAPAYYILTYGTCGYIIGYFLLPQIWRVGGSDAQREVVEETRICALVRAGRHAEALEVIDRRLDRRHCRRDTWFQAQAQLTEIWSPSSATPFEASPD